MAENGVDGAVGRKPDGGSVGDGDERRADGADVKRIEWTIGVFVCPFAASVMVFGRPSGSNSAFVCFSNGSVESMKNPS